MTAFNYRLTLDLQTQGHHGPLTLLRTRPHERGRRRRGVRLTDVLEGESLPELLSSVFSREALLVQDSQDLIFRCFSAFQLRDALTARITLL